MCGGSDHHGKEAHHQPSYERHADCSCGRLGGLISILVMLSMVTVVACDRGEVIELVKTNSAFRGAASLDLGPGESNFNLIQSLTSERLPLVDDDPWLHDMPAEALGLEIEIAALVEPHPIQPTRRHMDLSDVEPQPTRRQMDLSDAEPQPTGRQMDLSEASSRKLSETKGQDMSKRRLAHVLGACVVMLVASVLGVSLPHLIRKYAQHSSRSRRDKIRTICCGFAAGGFWGLALIHVLVEAVNGCSNIRYGITFASGAFMNAAFSIAALGYLLMLIIQRVASISSQKAVFRGSGEAGQFRSAMFDAAVASVALTFHAFFEGMVVGMRDTHLLIWIATISVIGHKWAAGFALSMRMEVHRTPKYLKWTTLSIFVAASPIGALVGMPLGTMEESGSAVFLNSLSAGILIFVAAETTAEVFGSGTCTDYIAEEPQWDSAPADCEEKHCKDPCCVNRSVDESRLERSSSQPPTFRLFFAQISTFIAGLALVFGMMTLHMRNPGHEHKD